MFDGLLKFNAIRLGYMAAAITAITALAVYMHAKNTKGNPSTFEFAALILMLLFTGYLFMVKSSCSNSCDCPTDSAPLSTPATRPVIIKAQSTRTFTQTMPLSGMSTKSASFEAA